MKFLIVLVSILSILVGIIIAETSLFVGLAVVLAGILLIIIKLYPESQSFLND